MNRIASLAAFAVVLAAASATNAQETHTVHFSPGTTGATIHGKITGNNYVDYRLAVSGGQSMDVIVRPDNVYFNVMAPGSTGEAIYNSSVNGNEYGSTIPADGTYTVRIYQMGAAKDEGKTHSFTLEIGVD